MTTVAAASELEVVVQIRGRGPLRDQLVVLGPPTGESLRPRIYSGHRSLSITDDQGRAYFLDLPPGTYQVELYDLERFGLVSPAFNPQAPPPVVTLERGETRRIDLEIWPGIPVRVGMTVDGAEVEGTASLRHRDTGQVLTVRLNERRPEGERLLAAGVWEVLMSAPSGYLLDSVAHDGYPLAGHRVTLDLGDQPFSTEVVFGYRVEAWIEGTVTLTEPGPLVAIEATLIAPGLWFTAAAERGGSAVQTVVRTPDPRTRTYRLPLPSGRWRLRPISPVPIESEPEEIELFLEPGTIERIDWTVAPSTGPDALTVTVRGAESGRVAGAVVEIRGRDAPAGPWHTGRHGSARVFGLTPGERYTVLAGHSDFLEAEAEIVYDPDQRFDPQTRRGSRLFLDLEEGAVFELEAIDSGGAPLRNVELAIERLAAPASEDAELAGSSSAEHADDAFDLPPIALDDAAYRASKLGRTITSDRRGRARAAGFFAGDYVLAARLRGSEALLGRVLLSARRLQPAFELEVALPEASTVRIDAQMVPAARLAATLQCDDGGALPPTADARIFRAIQEQGGVLLAVTDDEPAINLERRPLEGPRGNTLIAGPLDAGVFEIAVRPQGFERWTWAYETTERSDALPLRVERRDVLEGRELDLGVFVVECEPAADVVLTTAEGKPLWIAQAQLLLSLLDRELEAPELQPLPPPRHLLLDNFLEVRRIAAGKTRLRLELHHQFLLPDGVQHYDLDLDLERGGFVHREIELRDIGGAIVVSGMAPGARVRALRSRQGSSLLVREQPEDGERALLAPLPAASYRVEVCSDASCSEVLASWSEVVVKTGQTTSLGATRTP